MCLVCHVPGGSRPPILENVVPKSPLIWVIRDDRPTVEGHSNGDAVEGFNVRWDKI